jgi:hypothetical protein
VSASRAQRRRAPFGSDAGPSAGSRGGSRRRERPSSGRPSQVGKGRRRQEAAASGPPRKPYPVWLVTTAALLFPGSGQVLNADAMRGVMMQFFMMFMGYITWKVTGPDVSVIGRIAGGGFVYVISVIDANGIAKKRSQAWLRLSGAGNVGTKHVAHRGAGR